MANKDFYVTMKVTFTKTYVVNAKDWEHAEDYAEDELYGEVFNITDDGVDIEAYDVKEI